GCALVVTLRWVALCGPGPVQVIVAGAGEAIRGVGSEGCAAIERIEVGGEESLGAAASFNAGLDRARGTWVMFVTAGDRVLPEGVRGLVARADAAQTGGASGWVRFMAPMGAMPRSVHGPLMMGSTAEIGLSAVVGANAVEGCAQVVASAAVGDLRFDTDLGCAAGLEFFARCALVRGVRWAGTGIDVTERRVRGPGSDVHTIEEVQGFARGVRSVLAMARANLTPEGAAHVQDVAAGHTSALVRAGTGLLAHIEHPPAGHPGPGLNSAACGRWWARLGFVGPVPAHLLPDPFGEIPAEAAERREVAARVWRSLGGARRVVLVGLGRNGRALAAECAARGAELFGVDDGLSALPAWAAIDGRAIVLLRRIEDAPADAAVVVTVSDDAVISARLAARGGVVRWSEAAGAATGAPVGSAA
ncbi:MAG: hypothetical protein ACT4PL_11555, partial [Phycisphaerales bacterium]